MSDLLPQLIAAPIHLKPEHAWADKQFFLDRPHRRYRVRLSMPVEFFGLQSPLSGNRWFTALKAGRDPWGKLLGVYGLCFQVPWSQWPGGGESHAQEVTEQVFSGAVPVGGALLHIGPQHD